MDSSVLMTKQGVRNLNSLGPKKKRPEVVTAESEKSPELEKSAADPVKAPGGETSNKVVVPAG